MGIKEDGEVKSKKVKGKSKRVRGIGGYVEGRFKVKNLRSDI